MSGSVQHHQAEACEILEFAPQIAKSQNARADLAGISDRDATIVAMSKMMVSMVEVAKVANVTPAVVKRAHAIREAGRDKSMKRILTRAVDEVRTSIANSQYKRAERGQVEKSNMGRSSEVTGDGELDKWEPGYWAGHLAGLDMTEEKKEDEHSDIEANASRKDVIEGMPKEEEDLIGL